MPKKITKAPDWPELYLLPGNMILLKIPPESTRNSWILAVVKNLNHIYFSFEFGKHKIYCLK